MAAYGGLLWRSRRVHQIWGANTDVGKTVVSTSLCLAARAWWKFEHTAYLKPVSTGPLEEADHACVFFVSRIFNPNWRSLILLADVPALPALQFEIDLKNPVMS